MNHSALSKPIDAQLLDTLGMHDSVIFDPTNAIYTNRDLNMAEIKLVGFDMDYTLATYHKTAFDNLQYSLTISRLIEKFNYPHVVGDLRYQPGNIMRGLVIDIFRGNLLKLDARGQVWRAQHGIKQLSKSEIEKTYLYRKIKINNYDYIMIDTQFSMPKAALFCDILDLFETLICHKEFV